MTTVKVPKKPSVKRPPRSDRKVNPEKIAQLREQGMSVVDIAKNQDVSAPTVWGYISAIDHKMPVIKDFREKKASYLEWLQAEYFDIAGEIARSLRGDIAVMKPGQKVDAIDIMNRGIGIFDDKIRLHRGESTSNISVVTHLASQATEAILAKAKAKPKA